MIPPILILGKTGTLGRAFARICAQRHLACVVTGRDEIDVTTPESIAQRIKRIRPWAVINTTGYVRVDDAERQPELCYAVNTSGAANLALACAETGARLLTFSSDLVFDGGRNKPYHENDPVKPLNVYGLSKARAEETVSACNPDALIVRTSAFFGPWDVYNFAWQVLEKAKTGELFLAGSEIISPTYVPHLCHACLDLLIDEASGIRHLANEGSLSWATFARSILQHAGMNAELVEACETKLPARRPAYSVLGSRYGNILPTVDEALAEYLHAVSTNPPS